MLQRHKAEELIRTQQQGEGRPIISEQFKGHRVVAVRHQLMWSDKWKTFPDFLSAYIKRQLGAEWGNAELKKPVAERHPIMQWYDTLCRYQQKLVETPGEVFAGEVTGVVACYMGLAYSLYLLDHNVELQARLVGRLRDPGQFQGAYYELIVANILIRAGFELTLEDEADRKSKHCEFAAVSKATGKRYWVEAKMRGVRGLLGRTDKDGGPDDAPLSQLVPHLNKALAKPAADERLIFIDLNAAMPHPVDDAHRPEFIERAMARLEKYEVEERKEDATAYLFVTNFPFHRMLDERPSMMAAPFGLGMSDFNRPGEVRLSDTYRREKKHADAFRIAEAIPKLLQMPQTFDGSLPSETFGKAQSRVLIGETYLIGDGENARSGKVTTACVAEAEKAMYVGIQFEGGHELHRQPMSDSELEDYRRHPEAYFGQIVPVSRHTKTIKESFDFLMDANKGLDRSQLLERLKGHRDPVALEAMSDDELLAEYCEGMAGAMWRMRPPEPAASP